MTAHVSSPGEPIRNGAWAIADFALPQIALLCATPLLLRSLGPPRLGLWMLTAVAVTSGNLLSSGFGDAAVKYVAAHRANNDVAALTLTVRVMLSINVALGSLLAIALFIAAPFIPAHIAHLDRALAPTCISCLRIAGATLLLKSVESVLTCSLRALEQYATAARITALTRIATVLASVALAARGASVTSLVLAGAALSAISVCALAVALLRKLPTLVLLPSVDRPTLHRIVNFGTFSWLQALSALLFSSADRILVGVLLGAPALAVYGICVQAAQPIQSLLAAGFHALFPHLSARVEHQPLRALRSTVHRAFRLNLVAVATLAGLLIAASHALLTLWMGSTFAHDAWKLLTALSVAFALLALNVTAHYTLLALGRVRLVTAVNVAAGILMLAALPLVVPRFGLMGAAIARGLFGLTTCLLYIPLARLGASSADTHILPSSAAFALPENR